MSPTAEGTLTRGPADLRPATRALRELVRREAAPYLERRILVAESFRATAREHWHEIRWAAATAHVLEHCPIAIRPGEKLVGWHPNSHPDEPTRQAIAEAGAYLADQHYWVPASEGHMAPDYPTILSAGLQAIRSEGQARAAAADDLDGDTPERRAFYAAGDRAMLGLRRFIERYAELAEAMAADAADATWRDELCAAAAVCRQLIDGPARTFREAIQLVWFVWLGVALEASESHHCFGPGRLDQILQPYLDADRAAGRITDAEVDDLLDQLLIKCNEFDGPSMSAVIMVIGGRDAAGRDATNELSWRLLKSSCRVRMYFPGLDISWHPDMDPAFVRAAVTLLRNGQGQPSFFNDPVIVAGLQRYGVPFEHAVDHLPSTCTETSIQGRTNPWVAWPYVNLGLALTAALFGGRRPDTADVCGATTPLPGTWDELLSALDTQLTWAGRQAVARGLADQALAARWRPFPLLSYLVRGCLESGRNISAGGALYNFLQPEAVGVSNVVDSLAAIKSLVFDQGRWSLDEVRAALAANWEGWEPLRRAIQTECPKYGNDEPWVNELFDHVAGEWCASVEGRRNYFGGPVFPGFLGWVVWIDYGARTPATPDGRRAGEPLANSLAPCSGVKLRGVPSMLLSAAGFDHSRGLGGITFNLRYSGAALREPGGPDRLAALIATGLGECGLYMLQVEITSSETMRAAQADPAAHGDLLVRIGGYLVPFCLLPPQAQEEVIQRAELQA